MHKHFQASSYIRQIKSRKIILMLLAGVLPCKRRHIQLCVLILSLVLPFSACFSEKSQAIAAQEKEDGAMGALEVELRMKKNEWKDGLKKFKDKHPDLNNEGFDPNTITIEELQTLFEEQYKPYFETFRKWSEQNKNPISSNICTWHLTDSTRLLKAIPSWIREKNNAEMLKRIKADIKDQKI